MNISNLKIGHISHPEQGTGLTVFLFDKPARGGWWLCGSAPATRDVTLLDPSCMVEHANALLLTGGSAYGLDAAAGVMRWLREKNIGFPTTHGVVPIVPTAAIYDFNVKGMHIPTAEDAYHACSVATNNQWQHGNIGAGTGASVGKWLSGSRVMSGGFACAQINTAAGLSVLACVVVNAVGNILNEKGQPIAGAIDSKGKFLDPIAAIQANLPVDTLLSHENTVLAAIFTNADLSKAQLTRVSKMASAGIARVVEPAFTPYDGDVVFSFSLGEFVANDFIVGSLAADALKQAIQKAVENSAIIN